MMNSIMAITLSINITFFFTAITLWIIKKLNHSNTVFSSAALLFYIRMFLIVSLLIGVISILTSIDSHALIFTPFLNKIKLVFLISISVIGISLYVGNLISLLALIYQSPYRRTFKNVCVLYSDDMKACSFSLLNKSFIIVPISAVEIYEDHILTLRHEMQHCRQHDGLWNHVLEIIGVICWWNPAYQMVKKQSNHFQEICCDQAVITKYKITRKEYALTLLKLKNEHACLENGTRFKFIKSSVFLDRLNQIFYSQTKKRYQLFNWVRIIFVSTIVIFSSIWSVNATAGIFMKNFNNHRIQSSSAKEIK